MKSLWWSTRSGNSFSFAFNFWNRSSFSAKIVEQEQSGSGILRLHPTFVELSSSMHRRFPCQSSPRLSVLFQILHKLGPYSVLRDHVLWRDEKSYLRHSSGQFLSGLFFRILMKPMVSEANGSGNTIICYSHGALARNVHCIFNESRPWPH